jgi:hypothetical protein
MSAGMNQVYASTLMDLLNTYAGRDSETLQQKLHDKSLLRQLVEGTAKQPKKFRAAVVNFVAFEIYQVNGLGLLDNFLCASATVSSNLDDDNYFAGTATITQVPFTGKVLTTLYYWMPTYGKEHKQRSKDMGYKGPLGRLGIVDYDGNKFIIDSTVQMTFDSDKVFLEELRTYPRQQPQPGDYEEQPI